MTLHDAVISVDRRIVEAVQALERVQNRYGYRARRQDTGAYNCRSQKGSNVPSSHSWATAVDENWGLNPYRTDRLVTDMPLPMVEEVEALRTVSGAQVWRWGGDWDGRPDTPHSNYDAMHWEIVATPAELATGIVDPNAPLPEEDAVALRALQIKGENSLYVIKDADEAERIVSPIRFFVLAAGGYVSGEPQHVITDPAAASDLRQMAANYERRKAEGRD